MRVLNTEDGALWAAFVEGHVDLATISEDDILDAIACGCPWVVDEDDLLEFAMLPVRHFYLTQVNPAGFDVPGWAGDDTHWLCTADALGARAVTGIKGKV
ncbi:hypothetical protein V5F77_02740 [Xanthobacter sp. DSM 24535]|uniref:hypothetical protein n=1 Tax=Roseixanthobacter psychrophilus TaxID=3119917 RepID=UPI00372C7C6D